jgi:phospholipase/carboxylesterase
MNRLLLNMSAIEISPKTSAKASVIWLHGLGADGHDFADIVPELALPEDLGVRFIFPHAPIRAITFAGGAVMRAWFDVNSLRIGGIDDVTGIQESKQLINGLIDREIKLGIPSERIILAGFSQGGAIALYTGLCFAKPLAGIIVLSGFLPLSDQLVKEKKSANQNTPILMLHGDVDDVVAIDWAKVSYEELLAMGFPVEWQVFHMAHTVSEKEIKKISAWLKERLSI